MIALVDANVLYAAADRTDRNHEAALGELRRPELSLVLPALPVAEAAYLIGTRLGPPAEAAFARGVAEFDIELPTPEDWRRIADLIEQYADFPLGAADASIVALAERLGTDLVITFDRRHFSAVRPRHCAALALLPV